MMRSDADASVAGLTVNLIGAGRAGVPVARAMFGRERVVSVMAQSQSSARAGATRLHATRAVTAIEALGSADVWLLATPDDSLSGVVESLRGTGLIAPDNTVFHLSGVHGSVLLSPLNAKSVSVHPLKSFAADEGDRALEGVFCAIEGDLAGRAVLQPLLDGAGARTVSVSPDRKAEYHAASVLASNAVTGLLDQAAKVLAATGIDPTMARDIAVHLARGAVDNAGRLGTAEALTGPVVRGDIATVSAHLDRLAGRQHEVYLSMARALLDLACVSGRLPADKAEGLREVLDGELGQRFS